MDKSGLLRTRSIVLLGGLGRCGVGIYGVRVLWKHVERRQWNRERQNCMMHMYSLRDRARENRSGFLRFVGDFPTVEFLFIRVWIY